MIRYWSHIDKVLIIYGRFCKWSIPYPGTPNHDAKSQIDQGRCRYISITYRSGIDYGQFCHNAIIGISWKVLIIYRSSVWICRVAEYSQNTHPIRGYQTTMLNHRLIKVAIIDQISIKYWLWTVLPGSVPYPGMPNHDAESQIDQGRYWSRYTARLLFSEYLRCSWRLSSYEVPPSVTTRLLAGSGTAKVLCNGCT